MRCLTRQGWTCPALPCVVEEGIRPARRDAAADRPHRRRPALLLGQPQEARHDVQVIVDPKGRLLWVSPALPGALDDVRAAREHGISDALAGVGVACWADKGYQGARGKIRVPYRGRWEKISVGQQEVNRSQRRCGPASNRPSLPSSPGDSCASPDARPPGLPALSGPSSPSVWPAQTENGKGSGPAVDGRSELACAGSGGRAAPAQFEGVEEGATTHGHGRHMLLHHRRRWVASWNLGWSWNSAARENQVTGTAPARIVRCSAALWASVERLADASTATCTR